MKKNLSADLVAVVAHLSNAKIPWGVFAGAAASVYGSPRPIQDIDILIPSDMGSRIGSCFPFAKRILDPDGRIAMLKLDGIEIIAGLSEKICLELDSEMSARLVQGRILDVEVLLISLEDNLVFKAVLGRGPEVGKHDWTDIADMLAYAQKIDWDYLIWRLQRCAPEKAQEITACLKNMTPQ